LSALDTKLEMKSSAAKKDVERTMENHILTHAQ
jgi:hypothetical protein